MRSLALTAVAASLALSGCSMNTEWWVREAFQRAGYSKTEAHCTATGFASAVPAENLWEVRSGLMVGERPDRFDGPAELFAWLEPRVDAESRRVLRHYAEQCRGR